MEKTIASLGVTVDVPTGTDVTDDGSIFGPDGVELALYVEPPNAEIARRQEIIEGRAYVKTWGQVEMTADGPQVRGLVDPTDDGWLVLFETEDGELGFEIGRRRADATVVFWSHCLRDADAREKAIAIAKNARIN